MNVVSMAYFKVWIIIKLVILSGVTAHLFLLSIVSAGVCSHGLMFSNAWLAMILCQA